MGNEFEIKFEKPIVRVAVNPQDFFIRLNPESFSYVKNWSIVNNSIASEKNMPKINLKVTFSNPYAIGFNLDVINTQ